jgi:purine-binding chemotaxis protein CheW
MSRGTEQSGLEIDWQPIHRRLEQANAAAEEATRSSPEHARAILDERARRLARPAEEPGAAETLLDLLGFTMAGESYAIETSFVREVLRLSHFTALPGVPDFVVGVTNLRGEILPVFDLRVFFGLPPKGLSDRSRVIVCGDATNGLGILADAVAEVMQLSVAEFLDEPAILGSRAGDCIKGVTRSSLIVLDGAALLKDRRLYNDQTNEPTQRLRERGG